jgi:hypothetical protein
VADSNAAKSDNESDNLLILIESVGLGIDLTYFLFGSRDGLEPPSW